MEELSKVIADHVGLGLEMIAILVVAIGGIEAASKSIWQVVRGRVNHISRRDAWLSLARWLLLGLEFMLAADVVRTVISPSWQDIGQLAAVAVIRTFLNFFLERDLEAAAKYKQEHLA